MIKRFLLFTFLICHSLLALAGNVLDFTSETEDDFLKPDDAFQVQISAQNAQTLNADFRVAPGYYLYKQRIQFKDAQGKVLSATLPQGEMKNDPSFGKQEVYHHDFSASIALESAVPSVQLSARYQGCSEKGLCYAPITKQLNVTMPTDAAAGNVDNISQQPIKETVEDEGGTVSALKSGNGWLVIGAFFLAGLLLSLMPCVLPMIPILSSIIVGSKANNTQQNASHSFLLSLAYVLGMALSYTMAGVAAGLFGSLFSQTLQSPWVLAATALLFVLLALSMFGIYELKLPQVLEEKMLGLSNRQKGGQFLGVFSMGVISALIVSPCVAAPLAGALIYIGQTHNAWLGGLGLFTLALGMGVPLLLVGATSGALLPKPGKWMTAIRNICGVMMLLMAAYIAWPILPAAIKQPINKLLGLEAATHLPFKRVSSVDELDLAIKNANGKPVMLDFYADWCTACKEMEKYTFTDARVKSRLEKIVLLQADVTANSAQDQALLKRFNLFGPPGIIFFDAQGAEIKPYIVGYKQAADFDKIVERNTGCKADTKTPLPTWC